MSWTLLVPLIVGGFFLLLGIVFIIWGKREEANYYDSLTSRFDLREFVSRWPPRPEPGALKTGGWISIVVAIIIAGIGFLFWWFGK